MCAYFAGRFIVYNCAPVYLVSNNRNSFNNCSIVWPYKMQKIEVKLL